MDEFREELRRATDSAFRQLTDWQHRQFSDLEAIKRELEGAREERIRRSERDRMVSDAQEAKRMKSDTMLERWKVILPAAAVVLAAVAGIIGAAIGSHAR